MTPSSSESRAPSILICDDSAEEIRVLISMLRSAKYRLIIATNGKDAIDRAGMLQPDLILMDIRMPVMDGVTACRLLKAHDDTKYIPIIFLTAANDRVDRLGGLRLGAVDYIVKPACEEEVLLRIAVHINEGNQQAAHFNPQGHSRQTASLVEACVRMLEDNLGESPSTHELATRLGCSRRFLSAAFKEVFGTTVYEWLRERRMHQAKRWLCETNMAVQDISDDLGFSSSSNFTTAFRHRFGVAPREFRKAFRSSSALAESDSHLDSDFASQQ